MKSQIVSFADLFIIVFSETTKQTTLYTTSFWNKFEKSNVHTEAILKRFRRFLLWFASSFTVNSAKSLMRLD